MQIYRKKYFFMMDVRQCNLVPDSQGFIALPAALGLLLYFLGKAARR